MMPWSLISTLLWWGMVLPSKISAFKTLHCDHILLSFYHHYLWMYCIRPLVQHLALPGSSSSLDPMVSLPTTVPLKSTPIFWCPPLPIFYHSCSAVLQSLLSVQIREDSVQSHVHTASSSTLVFIPCTLGFWEWILRVLRKAFYDFFSNWVTCTPWLFKVQCLHYPTFYYSFPYCNLAYLLFYFTRTTLTTATNYTMFSKSKEHQYWFGRQKAISSFLPFASWYRSLKSRFSPLSLSWP